jgi:hypothetical protein
VDYENHVTGMLLVKYMYVHLSIKLSWKILHITTSLQVFPRRSGCSEKRSLTNKAKLNPIFIFTSISPEGLGTRLLCSTACVSTLILG